MWSSRDISLRRLRAWHQKGGGTGSADYAVTAKHNGPEGNALMTSAVTTQQTLPWYVAGHTPTQTGSSWHGSSDPCAPVKGQHQRQVHRVAVREEYGGSFLRVVRYQCGNYQRAALGLQLQHLRVWHLAQAPAASPGPLRQRYIQVTSLTAASGLTSSECQPASVCARHLWRYV